MGDFMGDIGYNEEEDELTSSPEDLETIPFGDEELLREVVDGLLAEDEEVEEARRRRKERVRKWRRHRAGERDQDVKDYPMPNASNVMVPVSLSISQSVFGLAENTFNRNPFWSIGCTSKDDKYKDMAAVGTKWMGIIAESRFDLDFPTKRRTAVYEATSLGMCVVKVPWKVVDWDFKRETEDGTLEQIESVTHLGPAVEPIPYEDFNFPSGYTSIQEMPWIRHRVKLPRHLIQNRMEEGIYEYSEKVLNSPRTTPEVEEVENLEREDKVTGEIEVWDVFEYYFFDDADGDGKYEDIIVSVHKQTGIVLRQQFNTLGIRPFREVPYFKQPFTIEGRGVCETLEYTQEEINAVHNIRNDNMKIGNMKVVLYKRGSMQQPGTRALTPGQMVPVNNPRDDVVPFSLGETLGSSMNEEGMLFQYAQRAVGMPEIMQGFSDSTLKSRDTARGQKTRLQQGTGIFETVIGGMKDAFSDIGLIVLYQAVHHRDEVIRKERELRRLSDREIELLEELLSIDVAEIPVRFSFSVRTTDLDKTYEVKRQNMLQAAQLFTQYSQQVMPLMQQVVGQQGQQMMQQNPDAYRWMNKIFTGSTALLAEAFKFFGEEDPDKYVPDVEKQRLMEEMLAMLEEPQIKQAKEQLEVGGDDAGFDNRGVEVPGSESEGAAGGDPGGLDPVDHAQGMEAGSPDAGGY